MLVRTAVFKSANQLVGWLLQQAVDRSDAAYQAKPGEVRKGREASKPRESLAASLWREITTITPAKTKVIIPQTTLWVWKSSYTPALAKLICLEGADEQTYLKAERHLLQTGGIVVSARQIQRVVQRVGSAAQAWQERTAQPGRTDAPIMYVSADGTGVPMVRAELEGRRGKQPDGKAKTRQVYLGCVFTQHRIDEKGHPVRDWESTTYVSSFKSSAEFGPCLRQEAIRRGMGSAGEVVVLIDGAEGLENLGKLNFKQKNGQACVQIVDFYHAVEHAGEVLAALIGKEHPDYKNRQHQWAKRLLKDKVRVLIEQTRQEAARQAPGAEGGGGLGLLCS